MLWRVKHEFVMRAQPAEAQAMFVRDIAPELRELRGFSLYKNQPGELAFGDERDLPVHELGELTGEGTTATRPSMLTRRLLERRIHVRFATVPEGTRVTVRGSAEKDARRALGQLGEPGQWPQTPRTLS